MANYDQLNQELETLKVNSCFWIQMKSARLSALK